MYCVKVSVDFFNVMMISSTIIQVKDDLYTDNIVTCLSSFTDSYGIDTNIQGMYALKFFKTKPDEKQMDNAIIVLKKELKNELLQFKNKCKKIQIFNC